MTHIRKFHINTVIIFLKWQLVYLDCDWSIGDNHRQGFPPVHWLSAKIHLKSILNSWAAQKLLRKTSSIKFFSCKRLSSCLMDSEISRYTDVYKAVQNIPSVVSAKVLPGDHEYLWSIHTKWQSQDFVKFEKNSFAKDYVVQKDNLNILSYGMASDLSTVHLEALSKTGELRAVLIERKSTDSMFLEVWNKSRKLTTFDMTEREEHGKINESDPFKCFEWSSDEKYLLYTAEEKRPKTVSFFKDSVKNKEKDDKLIKGEEYAYREEWGESCVGCHHSVLCIFEIETGKVEVFPMEEISIGEARWGPDNETVVFSGFNETPYRLGIRSCRNRRSQIYSINLKSKGIECLSKQENSCSHSPRFSPDFNTLVYLENAAGGPHFMCSKLQKYDWKTKTISTVVDIVNSADGDSFPGIYAESLPSRSWTDDGKYLYFTTAWRSSSAICCVNIESGEIQRLNIDKQFGSSAVLDVHDNLIIAVASAPNIEPCLVAGFVQYGESKPKQWRYLAADTTVKHSDISWNITKLQPKVPNNKYPNLDYEIIVINPTEKKKCPLIVIPHGGPHVAADACLPLRTISFVKLGYILCIVNYRGSTGFGEDSVKSLPGNIGTQDVEDVHNAVLYLKNQEHLEIGDVFFYGGSHGGFLGAHLIGQYPGFYKAACLLNPVTDLSVMIGVSDIPDWCWVEGGLGNDFKAASPVDPSNIKCMWDKSPIKYVEQVQTPTLLLLGKKDLRVPICQGYKYYQLLKARNVPAKIFHYEDNHSLLKTPHDGDVFVQIAIWFKKHSSSES